MVCAGRDMESSQCHRKAGEVGASRTIYLVPTLRLGQGISSNIISTFKLEKSPKENSVLWSSGRVMFPNVSSLCKKTDSACEHLWAAQLTDSTLKSRSEFRILRPSILKSLRGKWTIIDFMRPLGKVQKVWGYIWKLFANKKRCLKLPLQFTEIIGFSRVKMVGVFKVSLKKNNGKCSKCWYILVAQSVVYDYCHFYALITENGKGQQ